MTARWALTLVRLKDGNLRSRCSDSSWWLQHSTASVVSSQKVVDPHQSVSALREPGHLPPQPPLAFGLGYELQ